jgi:hypothetical protein
MRKLPLLFLFMLALVIPVKANDVYISSSGSGAQTGADCSNAKPYTYFNTAGNWNAAPTGIQIGPGSTAHLCDVIVGAAGVSNYLNFRADVTSGTAGNPITLKFENGAGLQSPWSPQMIEFQGATAQYLVIDGGTNGFVRNTLNGTPGGPCIDGPCTFQYVGIQISWGGCNYCEIKNLEVADQYVHVQCESSSGCDGIITDTESNAININGVGWSIHDNAIHDCGWCVFDTYSDGDHDTKFYNNNVYNMNHGYILAGKGNKSNIFFYSNHIHDMAAWDTGDADAYHHDGIHAYGGNGGTTGFYIYNNLFDGNQGQCCITSWVFLEGGVGAGRTPWTTTGSAYIFNNILKSDSDIGDGQLAIFQGSSEFIVGNTIIVSAPAQGVCIGGGAGTSIAYTIENNVLEGCDQMMSMDSTAHIASVDYNLYGNSSASNPIWQMSAYGSSSIFSTWKGLCGCDSHSQAATGAPLVGLSASGVPSSGFLGFNAGINLTSTATGNLAPLSSDTSAGNSRTPTIRPAVGNWTVGAYQGSGVIPPGPPPVTLMSGGARIRGGGIIK